MDATGTGETAGGGTTAARPARSVIRGAAHAAATVTGIRPLPLTGVRASRGGLVALTGDVLVVRGMRRYDVPPVLYGASFWIEPALRWWQAAWYAALPGHRVLPQRVVLGGQSPDEADRAGYESTRVAMDAARYVAADLLGLAPSMTGSGAMVEALAVRSPAAAVLRCGDVVVGVDATPVTTAEQLGAAVTTARLQGRRQVELEVLPELTGPGPGGPQRRTLELPSTGQVGLRLATHRPVLHGALDVELRLAGKNGGPSLGLMATLAILDALTPGSLSAGRRVAGTGTVDLAGRVGQVSGVEFKARAAADAGIGMLLVPTGTAHEIPSDVRRRLEVHEVGTVADALALLAASGGSPATLAP